MFEIKKKMICNMKAQATSSSNRNSVRLKTVNLLIFDSSGESWVEWINKNYSLIHKKLLIRQLRHSNT